MVPSALDVAASSLDTDVSPFGGGDSPPRAGDACAHPLDGNPVDEEPMASSMAVVTPELSNSPTPEFYPISGGPILESVSADDPMECTTGLGPPSEVMCTHSCFFLKGMIVHIIQ